MKRNNDQQAGIRFQLGTNFLIGTTQLNLLLKNMDKLKKLLSKDKMHKKEGKNDQSSKLHSKETNTQNQGQQIFHSVAKTTSDNSLSQYTTSKLLATKQRGIIFSTQKKTGNTLSIQELSAHV